MEEDYWRGLRRGRRGWSWRAGGGDVVGWAKEPNLSEEQKGERQTHSRYLAFCDCLSTRHKNFAKFRYFRTNGNQNFDQNLGVFLTTRNLTLILPASKIE
jgi:hypothetical protein